MNLKEYLTEGLNKCNIQITEEQTEKLLLFMDIVLRENKKFNLTAITDEKEFIEKHIIDSALSIKYIKNEGKLIDIGSGAGMPGIVIKILKKDLNILLLDSLNKRVNYLNNTIKELNLNNIEAIHQRAEELSHDDEYREQFDYVTARAVASLNVLLEYTIPFIKKESSFIALKGSKGEEEIDQSKNALNILSCKIIKNHKEKLPYSLSNRDIIEIKKMELTNKKYPRKQAKIKKAPL